MDKKYFEYIISTGKKDYIDKYLNMSTPNGIYLIFYFGKLKNKDLMLKKVYKSLPSAFENKIKIYCIDLKIDD